MTVQGRRQFEASDVELYKLLARHGANLSCSGATFNNVGGALTALDTAVSTANTTGANTWGGHFR